MKQNRGKQFEKIVKEQMQKAGFFIMRLQDSMGGYAGVNNPCDFLAYKKPLLNLVECKAIHGKFLNFKSHISKNQILGMSEAAKNEGVYAEFIVWFIDYDRIVAFTSYSILNAIKGGEKSFHYESSCGANIPFTKKRVMLYPNFLANRSMNRYGQVMVDEN